MAKSLIVLVIDHDTYQNEEHKPLTTDELLRQCKFVNDDASGMYGYEAWMAIFDVNPDFFAQLGEANLPLPTNFDVNNLKENR